MPDALRPDPDPRAARLARQARLVALVMAGTMLIWMGAQVLGGYFGLPARFAYLFDFAAIAALIWALLVTAQIWRARREEGP